MYYLVPTEAKSLRERYEEVDGVRLRYFVGGEGPPLVLVHGLGGAASNWVELAPLLATRFRLLVPELAGHGRSAPLLATRFRLLVPELAGHGRSAPLRSARSLDAFAEQVAALMAREGMSSAAVVGHSLGGTIALRLAVVRPELVSALVLAAPAGITSSTSTAANVITMLVISRPGRAVSPFRRVIAARKPLRYPAFWWWQVSDPAALSPRAVEGFLEGPGL